MNQAIDPWQQRSQQDNSLLEALCSCLADFQRASLYFPNRDDDTSEIDWQTLILKEAITAREEGQAQASLALLDIAIEHGFDACWVMNNKALALREMGDFAGAIACWEGLTGLEEMPDFAEKVQRQLQETQEQFAERERQQSLAVLTDLHEIVDRASRAALHLPARDADTSELDLQTLILKEAIAARNDHQPQLSLAMLEIAIGHGFDSLWLIFNKALALREMGDLTGAIACWEGLVSVEGMPDFTEKVQKQLEKTQEQLVQQRQDQPLAALKAMHGLLETASRAAQHLPACDAVTEEMDLQKLILKEAIVARNQGEVQLSLDLLDKAIEYQFDSLWLFHHKALALRGLGQLDAALSIWKDLSVHSIEGFSEQVQRCFTEAKVQRVVASAAQAEQSGNLEQAIERLVQALVQNPDSEELNAALGGFMRQRRSGGVEESDPYQTAQYQDQLDINHAFLMEVRSQLKMLDEAK